MAAPFARLAHRTAQQRPESSYLVAAELPRVECERLAPKVVQERVDIVLADAETLAAGLFDQPVVDAGRKVVEVGIVVEVVRYLRDRLQVDYADIRQATRRFEYPALEVERQVELPALDEIGPRDDRIRRPDEHEFRSRIRNEHRTQVAAKAFLHSGELARRLLELRVE